MEKLRERLKYMPEIKQTKERLLKRRDEINRQLGKVNRDLQMPLEQNEEDRAIQIEQGEVSITREANLRRELAQIEDHLLDFDEVRAEK